MLVQVMGRAMEGCMAFHPDALSLKNKIKAALSFYKMKATLGNGKL